MGDLSAHFSRSEFRDHLTHHLVGPDPELLVVLERIRAITGKPLRIVSGHRCRAHNALVGGARSSQHIPGRAADLVPGVITVGAAVMCGATGVGFDRHGWVVHVDVRPGPPVIFSDD